MERAEPVGDDPVMTQRQVVVCIDDDAPVLSAIRRLLRHEPYEVITTLHPSEVIDLVSAREVSLIIADQRMPSMLGTELLKTVRRRSPDTICVILTGHADLSDIAGAMNDGSVDRLIRKPWDDVNFRRMIRDLLDRKPAAGLDDASLDADREPPERLVRHIECEGRRSSEILAQISETLDAPQDAPGRVVFVLDNLMKISGSLTVFLSGIVGRIINRGARAALVDGSGTAGTFFELVGGRLPLVVYRTEAELGPAKRVLVVEGKSDYLEYLRTLIESAGHECQAVGSVGEAISRLTSSSFDLVLLDLVLPDAEGLEVARHILERQLSTPVVAISSVLDRPPAESPETGIRGRVSMPYSAREILDAIRDS